uniref:Exportin-1 n=1 Tax=Compsopogon caeruleus TaxID=31354 RepID=A0A7S1TC72_9RHOD|mmetsp:Transcript_16246/g.32948  ORF Transcript_16246/g.32948 Transcript_16246/m.32948 type:complete len:1088 (+) Transcript_16246:16-3279(+)
MQHLLDPSLGDDEFVTLLEQTMQVLYTASSAEQRNMAQNVLTELQNIPDAWTRVDKLLDNPAVSTSTKYYGLQIMENMIRYRWKTLARQTSEQVKNYIVNKVIELSSDAQILHRERTYVSKLNLILVQIVKQEWPSNWRGFISEIVGASKSSVSLCENNMQILSLLSEEVFEFSSGQMTQDKILELKNQFNDEFSLVFQLCQYVFGLAPELRDSNPSLLVATLRTLERFLSWIPLGYIFETQLIETLTSFILQPQLRKSALRCLVEIGSLSVGYEYDGRFIVLYMSFMTNLLSVLPISTDIAGAYAESDDETQNFVMDLALFLTGFFRSHLGLLDRDNHESRQALITGNEYLVKISTIEDVEVFKICLEWWHYLSEELYESESVVKIHGGPLALANPINSRKNLFDAVLSAVRRILISRMAKPEEVIIVEDENGEIVRETTKDTDAIALYKTMRETLVFLTHLNTEDSEMIMLLKLSRQMDGSEWSWSSLSSLCWAVGSISGAMSEEDEKKFLVKVIKDLLHLCEIKRGKDNKAVVASNIMYVVSQYPRFLRAHWKFLKTVVNKLFEFMHESHPGVQDMACDTFLTISQKCRRKFVALQIGETQPFIVEILENIREIINELEPHQVQSFYESCGCVIASVQEVENRNQLVQRLFQLPNHLWIEIIQTAGVSPDTLRQRETMKKLANILKTNERAASSLGGPYLIQLKEIYVDMLRLYRVYSDYISAEVAASGPLATKKADTRNMRAVKKEILRVVESFLSAAEERDRAVILTEVVEPITEPILQNYFMSIPDARDAEVLSLFTQVITYMNGLPDPAVRLIFQSVFGVTLEMVTKNFEDYPDARLQFFSFLRAVNQYNFAVLFSLDPDPSKAEQNFQLVINAIVWAFKHTEKNVAETGLQILLELLLNVEKSQYIGYFYKTYFKLLLNDVFAVLTDTLHRPGFKRHVQILAQLIKVVQSGRIQEPMWDQQNPQEVALASYGASMPSNPTYVRAHMIKLLSSAFPNLSEAQIMNVVKGMLEIPDDRLLKSHVRDFLVQTKEFSAGDNTDLFDEERQAQLIEEQKAANERLLRTPGLIPPVRIDDEMAGT